MAEVVVNPALAPVQVPEEAPLDAAAIRSRAEQLSLKRRRGGEEDEEAPDASGAEEDAARALNSLYEAAQEAMDEWDSSAVAVPSDDLGDLDVYLEWLRTKISVAGEVNRKASDEIGVIGEATTKGMIQLDVDIEALEYSLRKLDSEGLSHSEASLVVGLSDSTDSCTNGSIADKDCTYEVLKLDHQIGKSEMDLKLLHTLGRADSVWQFESVLLPSGAKVLEVKDNCIRVSLKAPVLTSDCVIYGQKFECAVDSFISDHELLIEVDEEKIAPKKVQIFPDDVCVDILIERLKSSREIISSPTLGWLIQQFQHHIILNALRRSLVNDANNSRHSFEYFEKEETIIAHLVRGIDVIIKISADWPLSSFGLKLLLIRNSGTYPTNLTSRLLGKAKELANGLELQIRRHLVKFVDAVEDILVRELQSELHCGSKYALDAHRYSDHPDGNSSVTKYFSFGDRASPTWGDRVIRSFNFVQN